MNILFCTTVYNQAMTGAGRFAQRLEDLQSHDSELQVFVLSEDLDDSEDANKFRVKLSTGAALRVLSYWYKSRDYCKAIEDVIKRKQIDLVFFGDAWLAFHWLQKVRAMPCLVAVRDDNALQVWKNPLAGIPGLLIRRYMEARSCRSAVRVMTNAKYMASNLSQQFNIPLDNISILHPVYADYSQMHRSSLLINPEEPVRILFVKNDFRRGGLDLLISALRQIYEYRFVLTIVGPVAEMVRKKYKALIQDDGNIEFDFIGREYVHGHVLDLMSQHHLFCVPSSREAFGVSNIEALAAGMRVVFYQTGGVPSELSQYGFPLEQYTTESCQKAIIQAIQIEPEVLDQKISAGQHWIDRTFSLHENQNQLLTIIKETVLQTSNPKLRTA